jgi:hypothetical protein
MWAGLLNVQGVVGDSAVSLRSLN